MAKLILSTALLTGLFCAGFALAVDWLTAMLDRGWVAGVSFVSGFLGSLVGQAITGRWRA